MASLAFVSAQDGVLKLVAISPAHATRLRFQGRDILRVLKKRGLPVTQVKVTSVPYVSTQTRQKKAAQSLAKSDKRVPISEGSRALISSCAQSCAKDNPALARSLKRLAQKRQKKGE